MKKFSIKLWFTLVCGFFAISCMALLDPPGTTGGSGGVTLTQVTNIVQSISGTNNLNLYLTKTNGTADTLTLNGTNTFGATAVIQLSSGAEIRVSNGKMRIRSDGVIFFTQGPGVGLQFITPSGSINFTNENNFLSSSGDGYFLNGDQFWDTFGNVYAGAGASFVGDGSGLTNLPASAISGSPSIDTTVVGIPSVAAVGNSNLFTIPFPAASAPFTNDPYAMMPFRTNGGIIQYLMVFTNAYQPTVP